MANPTGHIEINAVQYDFVKLHALKSYAHVQAVPTNACVLIKDCREIPPGSEPLAVEVTKPDGKKEYLVFAKNPNQLVDMASTNTKIVKVLVYSKFGLKKAKPENATVEPAYEQERPRYNEGRHEGRYQGNSNYQGGYQNNNDRSGYQSQGYQGNRPRIVGVENQPVRNEPFRPTGTFQQQQPARPPQQRTDTRQPDPRGGYNQPRNNY
jgi:hypothetical protein